MMIDPVTFAVPVITVIMFLSYAILSWLWLKLYEFYEHLVLK